MATSKKNIRLRSIRRKIPDFKIERIILIALSKLCQSENLPNQNFFASLEEKLKKDSSYEISVEDEKKATLALRRLNETQLIKLKSIRSKINHEENRFRASIDKRVYESFIKKFASNVPEYKHKKLFNEFIEVAVMNLSVEVFRESAELLLLDDER